MAKLLEIGQLPIIRLRDYPHEVIMTFDRWMHDHDAILAMIKDPLLGGRVIHHADRSDDGPRIVRLNCDHRDTAFAIKMRWG